MSFPIPKKNFVAGANRQSVSIRGEGQRIYAAVLQDSVRRGDLGAISHIDHVQAITGARNRRAIRRQCQRKKFILVFYFYLGDWQAEKLAH